MIHDLKILPEHFGPVVRNYKRAEVRFNDRGFEVGDILYLKEWSEASGYTGQSVLRKVIHIADLSTWLDGWILLSIAEED